MRDRWTVSGVKNEPRSFLVQWNHRAMAAVLGVVLRLPPIKQAMASRQVKSRYLEYLITHFVH